MLFLTLYIWTSRRSWELHPIQDPTTGSKNWDPVLDPLHLDKLLPVSSSFLLPHFLLPHSIPLLLCLEIIPLEMPSAV